jgi:hypothetical protein
MMILKFVLTMKKVAILLLYTCFNILLGQVDYQTEIQTIFNSNCGNCHLGNSSGGLNLSTYQNLMAGGNSGAVILPGNHANSYLWQKVNNGEMPPGNNPDLNTNEINLIAQWIDEGALENPALEIYNNAQIPKEYILNQNYPNPFNPVTTLRYDLPEQSDVTITIYNMLGRKVKTLVNSTQDAGFKSVIWDATNYQGNPVSAGVYLYKIQAGEYISTKKITCDFHSTLLYSFA